MANNETAERWFVLYTRAKFEKKIAEEIHQKQHVSYLPLRTVFRKWSDRTKRIQEPLFNNYVFVKIKPERKVDVLQIPGVIKMLSSEGRPLVVREQEIEQLMVIESSFNNIHHEPLYSRGDKVVVIRGALNGMQGELIGKIGNTRLLIKLPLLKQAISVEILEADINKV
jgi:transcription antitermination factor NusG